MKEKLIKVDNGWVLMVDNIMYATDNDKLSLKNCQAIERGYDLDEIAEQEFPYDFDCPLFETLGITEKSHKSILIGMLQGTLQKGFQKALELMGDKKFSEDDMIRFMQFIISQETLDNASSVSTVTAKYYLDNFQSLQQTEWDVEIEMEKVPAKMPGVMVFTKAPKLDADGCLILKRI